MREGSCKGKYCDLSTSYLFRIIRQLLTFSYQATDQGPQSWSSGSACYHWFPFWPAAIVLLHLGKIFGGSAILTPQDVLFWLLFLGATGSHTTSHIQTAVEIPIGFGRLLQPWAMCLSRPIGLH